MNSFQKNNYFFLKNLKTVKVVLCLMYLAGFIGLYTTETREIFKYLTSYNLWVSLFLLLVYHTNLNNKAIIVFTFVGFASFLIEAVGVATGKIFGEYTYGHTLGYKLFDTPISIGANWLILSYCTSYFGQIVFPKNKYNFIVIALFSSFLMVAIDFLIEPVAIKFDFWSWQLVNVPLQNYFSWFLVSFPLNLFLIKSNVLSENKLALLLLTLQVCFFIVHNLFL